MSMNAVGIDVSKGKSMVAILRPLNIILFEIMEKRSNTTLKISLGLYSLHTCLRSNTG